jgi:hypothetical protein
MSHVAGRHQLCLSRSCGFSEWYHRQPEELAWFCGGVTLVLVLEEKFGIPVFINNDSDLFVYHPVFFEPHGSPHREKSARVGNCPAGPQRRIHQADGATLFVVVQRRRLDQGNRNRGQNGTTLICFGSGQIVYRFCIWVALFTAKPDPMRAMLKSKKACDYMPGHIRPNQGKPRFRITKPLLYH